MRSAKEIEEKIKKIKSFLENEYGVTQIGYFGSFATGNQRSDSDVDLIVSFNKRLGWQFFELKDYLESIMGRRVDLVTKDSIRKQWKQEILDQVKYVY